MYYLNTRYYDPQVGRFINADGQLNDGLLGYNMYAYCENNPVMYVDYNGELPSLLIKAFKGFIHKVLRESGCFDAVVYDVPLYDQKRYQLCWAFCQVMIESYQSGEVLTQWEAEQRAIRIAKSSVEDGEDWNAGRWPTNTGERLFFENIYSLYSYVKQNGPIYAYYCGNDNAHLVVVTGVDIWNNKVYTNNPWGIKGEQTFDEFKECIYRGENYGMSLYCCYGVK